jgi:hypothetical protein
MINIYRDGARYFHSEQINKTLKTLCQKVLQKCHSLETAIYIQVLTPKKEIQLRD